MGRGDGVVVVVMMLVVMVAWVILVVGDGESGSGDCVVSALKM